MVERLCSKSTCQNHFSSTKRHHAMYHSTSRGLFSIPLYIYNSDFTLNTQIQENNVITTKSILRNFQCAYDPLNCSCNLMTASLVASKLPELSITWSASLHFSANGSCACSLLSASSWLRLFRSFSLSNCCTSSLS